MRGREHAHEDAAKRGNLIIETRCPPPAFFALPLCAFLWTSSPCVPLRLCPSLYASLSLCASLCTLIRLRLYASLYALPRDLSSLLLARSLIVPLSLSPSLPLSPSLSPSLSLSLSPSPSLPARLSALLAHSCARPPLRSRPFRAAPPPRDSSSQRGSNAPHHAAQRRRRLNTISPSKRAALAPRLPAPRPHHTPGRVEKSAARPEFNVAAIKLLLIAPGSAL